MYINNRWCNHIQIVTTHCSQLVEFFYFELLGISIMQLEGPIYWNWCTLTPSPRPHLGDSVVILSIQDSAQNQKAVQKQIRVSPEVRVTSALQDCFENTDWSMFREAATHDLHIDIDEYTDSVTCFIEKCIGYVTVTKTITTRANQKLWMKTEVRKRLKMRDAAFRSEDKAALRLARTDLSQAIKKAKLAYTQKIEGHFRDSGDTRCIWQGI